MGGTRIDRWKIKWGRGRAKEKKEKQTERVEEKKNER